MSWRTIASALALLLLIAPYAMPGVRSDPSGGGRWDPDTVGGGQDGALTVDSDTTISVVVTSGHSKIGDVWYTDSFDFSSITVKSGATLTFDITGNDGVTLTIRCNDTFAIEQGGTVLWKGSGEWYSASHFQLIAPVIQINGTFDYSQDGWDSLQLDFTFKSYSFYVGGSGIIDLRGDHGAGGMAGYGAMGSGTESDPYIGGAGDDGGRGGNGQNFIVYCHHGTVDDGGRVLTDGGSGGGGGGGYFTYCDTPDGYAIGGSGGNGGDGGGAGSVAIYYIEDFSWVESAYWSSWAGSGGYGGHGGAAWSAADENQYFQAGYPPTDGTSGTDLAGGDGGAGGILEYYDGSEVQAVYEEQAVGDHATAGSRGTDGAGGSDGSYSSEAWADPPNWVEYYVFADVFPSDGGYPTPYLGYNWYDDGAEVSLIADPFEGFTFVNFTINGTTEVTENPYSFVIHGDTEFVAYFEGESEIIYFYGISTFTVISMSPMPWCTWDDRSGQLVINLSLGGDVTVYDANSAGFRLPCTVWYDDGSGWKPYDVSFPSPTLNFGDWALDPVELQYRYCTFMTYYDLPPGLVMFDFADSAGGGSGGGGGGDIGGGGGGNGGGGNGGSVPSTGGQPSDVSALLGEWLGSLVGALPPSLRQPVILMIVGLPFLLLILLLIGAGSVLKGSRRKR